MARFASEFEVEVHRRLTAQIRKHHRRNIRRTLYADAENTLDRYNLVLPDGTVQEQTPLFWPGKAIDVFSSRLRPAGYSLDDDALLAELESVMIESEVSLLESMAIRSALRHGPSFVFTSLGDESAGEPRVIASVSSALSATCEINRRTGAVVSAIELLGDRRSNLHLPGVVLEIEQMSGGRLVVREEYSTPSNRIQVAPYVHGMTAERPFGSSRVTRPVMGFTDAGMRTFMRSEVSSAWYMSPKETWLGVDPNAFEDAPGWVSMIGGRDMLPDVHPDDEPNLPDSLRRAEIHTAPQMSMQPFSDQMRMIAGMFSGASSIPPSYLGIVADSNPQSAQAVWASEIDLVRAVEDQYPSFGRGRRMLAMNMLSLLHGSEFDPRAAAGLREKWQDAKTRSPLEQGQFVAQQVQVGNFQPGTRATLEQLPIGPDEARRHAEENRRASGVSLLGKVLGRGEAQAPAPQPEAETAADLKAKMDALGVAIRAGIEPESAASRVGLEGLKFTGAAPVALRLPEREAEQLEG